MSIRSLMLPYPYPYVPSVPTHYSEISYMQQPVPRMHHSPQPFMPGMNNAGPPYMEYMW